MKTSMNGAMRFFLVFVSVLTTNAHNLRHKNLRALSSPSQNIQLHKQNYDGREAQPKFEMKEVEIEENQSNKSEQMDHLQSNDTTSEFAIKENRKSEDDNRSDERDEDKMEQTHSIDIDDETDVEVYDDDIVDDNFSGYTYLQEEFRLANHQGSS